MAALPTGRREISGWLFHDPRNSRHIGLDYACDTGDPIVAAQRGTVVYVGENDSYGIHVLINHGGTRTLYAHLSQALAYGRVSAGQIIGVCGSTGASTSSHLHLEVQVYRDGQWVCVDPAGVEP
jgi:murein DD-endopeptidase MepM/ murein hydrolase activator NlpD